MILAALALVATQHVSAPVQAALDAGDFGDAYAAALALEPGVGRQRALSELHYRARDPELSLAAARQGLESEPQDLFLLHRATSSALWLESPVEAEALNERLRSAVAAAQLSPEERGGWEIAVNTFAGDIGDLRARHDLRERVVSRGRMAATLLIGLPLALMAMLLWRDGRAR